MIFKRLISLNMMQTFKMEKRNFQRDGADMHKPGVLT